METDKTGKQERSYHHGDLKTALTEAALVVLEQDGVEAISFREIARRVGVSRTAPYNHFESKEHLLVTLIVKGLNELQNYLVESEESETDPRERLRKRFRAYIKFAHRHPQLYRLTFGVGAIDWGAYPEMDEVAQRTYDHALSTIEDYYKENGGLSQFVAQAAAISAWSTFHGFSMLLIDGKFNYEADGRFKYEGIELQDMEGMVEMITDWFIAGLDAGAKQWAEKVQKHCPD